MQLSDDDEWFWFWLWLDWAVEERTESGIFVRISI